VTACGHFWNRQGVSLKPSEETPADSLVGFGRARNDRHDHNGNLKLESAGILNRFMDGHIDFPEYIAATDATFANALPRFTGQDIPQLRAVMLANHDIVMEEMVRRTQPIV
jgi:hypothetical protein